MLKKLLMALVAVMILLTTPATAGDPDVETGRPAPADPGYDLILGVPGPPGPQGPRGYQGPAGPPPSDAQVQRVVERVMAAQEGAPIPDSYLPILRLAIAQGYVVGYPDGEFRWNRRATRAEVTLIVMRVAKDLDGRLDQLEKGQKEIWIRIEKIEAANQRQDEDIRGLRAEDQRLWSALNGRTIALAFLVLSVGLAAAAFGLVAAIAAANHD